MIPMVPTLATASVAQRSAWLGTSPNHPQAMLRAGVRCDHGLLALEPVGQPLGLLRAAHVKIIVLHARRGRRSSPNLVCLDRSNYSIDAADSLTWRLHITLAQVGVLGGLFFISYFLFQVPTGGFAEQRSVNALLL